MSRQHPLIPIILQEIGLKPFDWQRLENCALTSVAKADLKTDLRVLIEAGDIVLQQANHFGALQFQVKPSKYAGWVTNQLKERQKLIESESADDQRIEPLQYHDHDPILDLIAICAKIKMNGLPAKRDGQLIISKLEALCPQVHLSIQELQDRIQLAMRLQVIVFDSGTKLWRVMDSKLVNWFSGTNEDMRSMLISDWIECSEPLGTVDWNTLFAMAAMPANRWISIDQWEEMLLQCDLIPIVDRFNFRCNFIERIAEPLARIGLLECGKKGDVFFWRWEDGGTQSVLEMIALPDGQYYVSTAQPMRVHYLFHLYGECEYRDRYICRYRIPETIDHETIDPETMFMTEHSQAPLYEIGSKSHYLASIIEDMQCKLTGWSIELPTDEAWYPGLKSTSPAWIKSERSYHISTKVQIIERAMRWRCYLDLQLADRKIRCSPEQWAEKSYGLLMRIQNAGQSYEISLDDIAGMKIVLPGVNV